MKPTINLIAVILLIHLNSFAQFKGVNVKPHKSGSKPIYLKSFSIQIPNTNKEVYALKGKIPGKAEIGFLVSDKTDKLSFYTLARYWNRNKKINEGGDYALKLAAMEFSAPKGYEGVIVSEKFIPQGNKGLIYWRKYARTFNKIEQDTVEMIEITYIQKNQNINREIIAFDFLMIGYNLSVDSALNLAKAHIDLIKPNSPSYNKKWNVETGMFMPFGSENIPTDLAYVRVDGFNSYFYKLDLRPGNLTGWTFSLSRNIKRNLWVTAGLGSYSENEASYDSLYKRGYYEAPPVLYNVKLNTSNLNYARLGFEYRYYLSRRQSINAVINLKYNYGDKYIQLSGKQSLYGPTNTFKINYKNSVGFDFGVKYQYYFKNQRWGFNTGLKYLYTKYEIDKFTINDMETDISAGPYFFPKLKTMNISGIEFMLCGFFQF